MLADAFQQQVSQRLRQLVGDVPAQLRGPITMLVDAPGKRLRSGLVHACARFGHEAGARVVRTGCVVELLHIASLLHDDVVDGAATRRGAPAVHLLIGAESALLGGLACFALVGVEAAALGEATSRAVSVTTAELAYGQMLDLERAFDTTLAMSDYLELVARKTADLFRLCCMLGAAESGADAGEVASLGRFGVELGIAFQILDDCLEIEATDSGKPMGTDHLRGLFGAPTLLALHADATGTLTELLLDPRLSAVDLPAVRARVAELGGLAQAQNLARERYRAGFAALDVLGERAVHDALERVVSPVWQRLL